MSDWKHGDQDRRQASVDQKGFTVRYELLGIIGLMIVQLVGAAIWAANIGSDVKYLRSDISEFRIALDKSSEDRYTGKEAAKDLLIIEKRFIALEGRVANIERVQ